MRHFRPRPDEFIDDFQYSKGGSHFHEQNAPPSPKQKIINSAEFDRYRPNEYDLSVPPPLPTASPPNQVEKGGFIPMLPGYKGFTPIKNPYAMDANKPAPAPPSETVNERPGTGNTDSLANESMHATDDEKDVPVEEIENKYPLKVSTLAPSDVKKPSTNTSLLNAANETHNKIEKVLTEPKIRPNPITPILSIPQSSENIEKSNNGNRLTVADRDIKHPPASPPLTPSKPAFTSTVHPHTASTFSPNTSDVFNLSKNGNKFETNGTNQTQNRNVLSALVAPGAQNVFRAGRPTITKVFSTSVPPPSSSQRQQQPQRQPQAPILPLAEEYLRTQQQQQRLPNEANNQSTLQYDTTPLAITNNLFADGIGGTKADMDWYFNNYNRSKNREHADLSSLNRFRSSTNSNSVAAFHTIPAYYTVLVTICLYVYV